MDIMLRERTAQQEDSHMIMRHSSNASCVCARVRMRGCTCKHACAGGNLFKGPFKSLFGILNSTCINGYCLHSCREGETILAIHIFLLQPIRVLLYCSKEFPYTRVNVAGTRGLKWDRGGGNDLYHGQCLAHGD